MKNELIYNFKEGPGTTDSRLWLWGIPLQFGGINPVVQR